MVRGLGILIAKRVEPDVGQTELAGSFPVREESEPVYFRQIQRVTLSAQLCPL